MHRNHQYGLSLVELMIAMVISLVLLAGVSQVYLSNKQTYTAQDALARMQENGRYAIDVITEDLRRAGYMGGNADITAISGTEPPVAPGNTCANDNNWGRMIGQRIFGLNDDTTADYACIPDADHLRGDILVSRHASPSLVAAGTNFNSNDNKNRLYLRSTLFGSRIFIGSKQANADNLVTSSMPPGTRELLAHAYYIREVTRDCPNSQDNKVPALYREVLDKDGNPAAQELASGIENLQVQYGVDTDADGVANRYFNANGVANWTQVRSVRVWLLARSECPEYVPPGESANIPRPQFAMGDLGVYPPNADINTEKNTNKLVRRQLYTSTVMLRN